MLKRILPALFLLLVVNFAATAQEVEVDRYNINARIDTAASAVDVRASLSISNAAQSSKSDLYFRLTKMAKVTGATVNGGTATVKTSDDRRVTTLSQVIISAPTAIEAGGKATVEVNYRIEAPESTQLIHIYPGEVLLA